MEPHDVIRDLENSAASRYLRSYTKPHYEWPIVDDRLDSAISKQTHKSLSDRDGQGVIGQYEAEFAKFVDADHIVSFASGTAAIHAMSKILNLGPGDAILAPAYTFPATASPFAYEGVEVIFCDADAFGNVTLDTVRHRMRPNVKALIITHMWGNPCDTESLRAFCDDQGIALLEDCSHAHFASWKDQRVGSTADMAVFSTNQKAITTGEGGILVCRDAETRDLALLYGHYNKRCIQEISMESPIRGYAFTGMGLKHRMTTLGAAIGIDQLRRAAAIESGRRSMLDRFSEVLSESKVLNLCVVDDRHGKHGLYVLPFRYNAAAAAVSRDEFVGIVSSLGGTSIDVPGSTCNISREPLFRRKTPWTSWTAVPEISGQPRDFPGVDAFEASFIKLPIWGYETHPFIAEAYLDLLSQVSDRVVY